MQAGKLPLPRECQVPTHALQVIQHLVRAPVLPAEIAAVQVFPVGHRKEPARLGKDAHQKHGILVVAQPGEAVRPVAEQVPAKDEAMEAVVELEAPEGNIARLAQGITPVQPVFGEVALHAPARMLVGKAGACHPETAASRCIAQHLQIIGRSIAIIDIQEGQIAPARLGDSRVARRAGARIALLPHQPDAVIRRRSPLDRLHRGIGRAIVHEDDLEVAQGLPAQAIQAAADPRACVVDGHDHAHHGRVICMPARPGPYVLRSLAGVRRKTLSHGRASLHARPPFRDAARRRPFPPRSGEATQSHHRGDRSSNRRHPERRCRDTRRC